MDISVVGEFKCENSTVYDVSAEWVALSNQCDVLLHEISSSCVIPLKGHHQVVTAVAFGFKRRYLFSASGDYLIEWVIEEVTDAFASGGVIRGHIISSLSETPTSISSNEKYVCLIFGSHVQIHDIDIKQVIQEVPIKNISCVEFLKNPCFVMTSYSGSLSLWEFGEKIECWKKQNAHGCSLICLAVSDDFMRIVVGSSTAVVQEFIYCKKLPSFQENMKVDLDERFQRSFPNSTQAGGGSSGQVLDITYVNQLDPELDGFVHPTHVVCATERALFHINFSNHNVQVSGFPGFEVGLLVAKDAKFYEGNKKMFCALSHILENKIFFYSIWFPLDEDESTNLTVLSCDPILKSSPLSIQVKSSNKSAPPSDQSLTFKKKVKSSGYTAQPRMTMFKPQTSSAKQSKSTNHKPIKIPIQPTPFNEAPDWSNQVLIQPIKNISQTPALVKCIAINDSNDHCAFGLSDATIRIARFPFPSNVKNGKVISGHNKPVIGCCWANQSDLIMTYSPDRDVKLWEFPFSGESPLSFFVEPQSKDQKQKSKDLAHAQFYYLDKFILSALGNSLLLHKYLLHDGPRDDVKRYLNKGKQKVAGVYPISDVQSITCVAAANNMFSYAVLCGASDRTLRVFDMNRCEYVHTFNDAHTRAPHTVRLFTGSSIYSSSSCDQFVTSAPADGIKLWDVRIKNCVRKFFHHPCVSKCEVTVSPCGRFVATTTHEKSVYVYDVRSPIPVHVLQGRREYSCVRFAKNSQQVQKTRKFNPGLFRNFDKKALNEL